MVVEQIKERRALQREFQKLRRKHMKERSLIAQKVRQALKVNKSQSHQFVRSRNRGPDLSI
jgi:hypothetical protein